MEAGRLTATELILATRAEMRSTRYTELSMKSTERVWARLAEYLQKRKIEYLSEDIGLKFLLDQYGITATQELSSYAQDCLRAIHLLIDFQEHQKISIRKKSRIYSFPSQFEQICRDFIDFRKDAGVSIRTIEISNLYLERFTAYLDTSGVDDVSSISSAHIIGFIHTSATYYSIPTTYCIACLLRVFFRYLYDTDRISSNLALSVPQVRCDKKSKVPSAYSREEIQRILESVDRGNPKGKRDYAMMLIAIRLGMRAGDICGLTFESFKWETNTIELIQNKGGAPQVLPLLNDVGEAVIDYIKYARPAAKVNHIFLRLSAPIGCLTAPSLHSIVTFYMRKANIDIQEGKKHGPHALRHSLASALLDHDTPMPVISEILGHADSATTSGYLKIDILHMRDYALEVPPLNSNWFGGGF